MRPRLVLFAAVLGAVPAAMFACNSTNLIAPELAEKAIAAGLVDKGLEVDKVACPSGQPSTAGTTFTCTATTRSGDSIPVDVGVQDDSGHVTWELRGVVVHEKLMGEGVQAQYGGAIRVRCPDKVAVIAVGGSFLCEAGSGDTLTEHIAITITDKLGNETAKIVP